jgi:hypothetical protein
VSPDGSLWLAQSHPSPVLIRVAAAGAVVGTTPLPGRAQIFFQIAAGPGPVVWVGARGYVARYAQSRVRTYRLPYGGCELTAAIAPAISGGLWYLGDETTCMNQGYYLGYVTSRGTIVQTQTPFYDARNAGGPSTSVRGLALGSANTLWILGQEGQSTGLYRVTECHRVCVS